MIETSHKIFLSLFFNYYQRDKFMNLLSVILSNAFKLLRLLSRFEIGVLNSDNFLTAIENNADKFENSYHHYYISYVDLKTSLNEKVTSIYSTKNFTKIIGTFEPVIYPSNFIQEVEHLGFLAKYNALNEEGNLDNIKEDYQILFNGSFLLDETIPIKSSSIKTMYYLTKNFGSVFYIFFDNLTEECEDKFTSYSDKTKKIYTILEILGFILYSSFFIINFIYLFHTSDLIFRNIFNIFIDFTQEGAYSFKNHYDNLIIVKKINEYRAVLIDFTMKNLDKYNEKINSQNALEYSINDNYTIKSGENEVSIDNNNTNTNNKNIHKMGSINDQKRKSKNTFKNMNTNINNINNINNTNNNQTNETKSLSTTLSKSSFIKFNQNTLGGNTISKLNEKANKIKKKPTDEKTKDTSNINSNSISTSGIRNSIIGNELGKEILDEDLTSEKILNKMYNDGIIQIKILYAVLLGLYIIIIVYFFVKLFMSLNFCSDIKRIFDDFGSISSRSSSVFYYWNSIKILLLVPSFGDQSVFQKMIDTVNGQKLEINKVLKYNIINYKNCQHTFQNLQKDQEDIMDYFLNDVCRTNEKCKQIYASDYNLFKNGYTTTMDSILLYTENFYNDYTKYNNGTWTNEEINGKLLDFDFIKIDICLNYLLSEVQEVLYESFEKDEFSIKDNYHITINILNSCAIAYSAIIGVLIMIFVIRLLRNLSENIKTSGNRINNAFCFVKVKYFKINN